MRLRYHFILLAFLGFPYLSHGQVKVGIKSGANISTITRLYRDPKNKLGWYAGVAFIIPIDRNVSLQSEILFSSKGVSVIPTVPPSYESSKNKLQFNYVNLPILISYGIDKRTKLVIGPELGYLLSVRHRNQTTVFKSDFYYPKKFDIGIVIGAGYLLIKRCKIELRYSYGFKTMHYRDITGTYTREGGANRTFEIGLNYLLK